MPPVIRLNCIVPQSEFKEWARWIKEINKGIDIITIPQEAETVSTEVVEIVRCKDCKNASTTEYLYCTNDGIAECQSVYCGHYRIYMELNHYCSHGERRE